MQYAQRLSASQLIAPHLISSGLTLVTGPRGIGKSLWCSRLMAYATKSGFTMGGISCPPQIQNGVKTGIWLADNRTGERRLLGSRLRNNRCMLPVGRWYFDARVMDWGNSLLKSSFDSDVILIDEIGPLELFQREGFQAGIRLLDQQDYRSAMVVIRPHLLAYALSRWSPARVYEIIGENP